jgi:hypothetical protein
MQRFEGSDETLLRKSCDATGWSERQNTNINQVDRSEAEEMQRPTPPMPQLAHSSFIYKYFENKCSQDAEEMQRLERSWASDS